MCKLNATLYSNLLGNGLATVRHDTSLSWFPVTIELVPTLNKYA